MTSESTKRTQDALYWYEPSVTRRYLDNVEIPKPASAKLRAFLYPFLIFCGLSTILFGLLTLIDSSWNNEFNSLAEFASSALVAFSILACLDFLPSKITVNQNKLIYSAGKIPEVYSYNDIEQISHVNHIDETPHHVLRVDFNDGRSEMFGLPDHKSYENLKMFFQEYRIQIKAT